MKCPICNAKLDDDDGKEGLKWMGKKLASMASGVGLATATLETGKSIYYSFSNLPKVKDFLWCPKCKNYFLTCPRCDKNVSIGVKHPTTGKKHKCTHCYDDFVYITPPDLDTYLEMRNNGLG